MVSRRDTTSRALLLLMASASSVTKRATSKPPMIATMPALDPATVDMKPGRIGIHWNTVLTLVRL
jgi:hypothetical protein